MWVFFFSILFFLFFLISCNTFGFFDQKMPKQTKLPVNFAVRFFSNAAGQLVRIFFSFWRIKKKKIPCFFLFCFWIPSFFAEIKKCLPPPTQLNDVCFYNERGGFWILLQACGGNWEIKIRCAFKCDCRFLYLLSFYIVLGSWT